MYIKTIPGRGMFVATNHTEFNAALNDLGGTKGVAYSPPWDMSTHTGRTYMSRAYDKVGRIFAGAQLDNKVGPSSALCSNHASSAPTPVQKACLYAIKDSKTAETFTSAVQAAVRHGALTRTAATILTDHPPGVAQYIPPGPRLAPRLALRLSPQVDQVDPQVNPQVVSMQVDSRVALQVDPQVVVMPMDVDLASPSPVDDAFAAVDSLEPRPLHIPPRTGGGNALVPPQRKKGKKKR